MSTERSCEKCRLADNCYGDECIYEKDLSSGIPPLTKIFKRNERKYPYKNVHEDDDDR